MVKPSSVLRFVVGVSALVIVSQPAAAELLVAGAAGMDSVKVGSAYSDDHVFKLPASSELRLLRSPDNTPFVMRGPYEGTLSNFIASCNGLLAAVRTYCRDSAGDRPPVGATRGVRPHE